MGNFPRYQNESVFMSSIKLVTVPIGNHLDITLRALEVLKNGNIIYCEDTRVFKELCKRCEISLENKSIRSFHDHSSEVQLRNIIELAKTQECLFVSDAGSPIISDPAYPLVQQALRENVKIESIGGISSVTSALELSALPPIPFHFHGFLARDSSKFNQDLELISSQYGTHIFFEGKSRVIKTLQTLSERYPDFQFTLCRELTKEFESVYRFKGKEFTTIVEEIILKGEFVILIHNSHKENSRASSFELQALAKEIIDKGARPKKLAKLLALITQDNSKLIYESLMRTRQ